MGTGKKVWSLIAVLVIVCSLPGCAVVARTWMGWTPYGGIGGNTSHRYGGTDWQVGMSFTVST